MQHTTLIITVLTYILMLVIFSDRLHQSRRRIKTTPCSECALNALAIDKPLEYARLYLEGGMQIWVNAEDSLELW